jgi:tetratricopeptide (TPR) repeat protein
LVKGYNAGLQILSKEQVNMYKYIVPILLGAVLTAVSARAETWHLGDGGQWQEVSQSGRGRYLMAIAEIKKLVDSGDAGAVKRVAERLKEDFPEFSGEDWDAFMSAELLYCEGKFVKAARAYDKLLDEQPQSDLRDAALERQFAIGTAFLNGQKISLLGIFRIKAYEQGVKLMSSIADRAGDSPIGIRAAVATAESYEKRGKFNDAHLEWSFISSRWPTGEIGREALLNMARCKHAAYKGPRFDASCLVSAKSYYENFKSRYPEYAQQLEIDKRLEQIEEQLAYKQFTVGEYYEKVDDSLSANLYYQMVSDDWPASTAAKMVEQKQY